MQRSVMTWESYYIKPDGVRRQVVQNSIQSSSSEVLTQRVLPPRSDASAFYAFILQRAWKKSLPRQKNLTNKKDYVPQQRWLN